MWLFNVMEIFWSNRRYRPDLVLMLSVLQRFRVPDGRYGDIFRCQCTSQLGSTGQYMVHSAEIVFFVGLHSHLKEWSGPVLSSLRIFAQLCFKYFARVLSKIFFCVRI